MAFAVDILHLFPELAAIAHAELQRYCRESLQRPVECSRGVTEIIVDDQRNLLITLNDVLAGARGAHIFIPIDELLGYIVEQHFADADDQFRLLATIRDVRHHWEETGRDYEATVGRIGTLYLVCKTPACAAQLVTDQVAAEGQPINCPTFDIMCLKCGQTHP